METLKRGDESGLKYFMSHFGESLRFFAFKITKNKEASEEIVSESFFKLWERRTIFSTYEGIKSFLYLVTRNASFDYKELFYNKVVSLIDEEPTYLFNMDTDTLSQIIYAELIVEISLELAKLPKQQAEVFRMSYLEGMDTKEICDALGTTASAVYFAKSKALFALRMVFKEKDINLYMSFLLITGCSDFF
ncbi:RNA polymerase sigma factor [Sphingobacterium faecale]|uniref:Sigma-70 family RNA polymerase sigma factor n=1 Tax=Sphingobacterium faecale TaxID=2803775 RepID=A0ABS1R0N1_9SPHI|nr:sigma-70 family RNA polymerase sigma factor [Sphingobacterium faecale]MBL1408257.1 sigma-70 family RNA polymerase sigma factor [Sphingobacterium faecale]